MIQEIFKIISLKLVQGWFYAPTVCMVVLQRRYKVDFATFKYEFESKQPNRIIIKHGANKWMSCCQSHNLPSTFNKQEDDKPST